MEIHYEDIMNKNLREELIDLVRKHKIIYLKGLNSSQRYQIYRQMYHPLSFEKIEIDDDDKVIKVYDKTKKEKMEEEETEIINREEESEGESEEESERESERESEGDSEEESDNDYESESTEDDSYNTEELDKIEKLENMLEMVINNQGNINKNIQKMNVKINVGIILTIICWGIFLYIDPVRLIIEENNDVCII